jgi:hypothetical protein
MVAFIVGFVGKTKDQIGCFGTSFTDHIVDS